MSTADESSPTLEQMLADLQAGKESAAPALADYAVPHFRRLIYHIRKPQDRLRRWVETDDVIQQAAIRLWRALKTTAPPNALAFQRLLAMQIRRELVDLARHHFGPQGLAANYESQAGGSGGLSGPQAISLEAPVSCTPEGWDEWCEFHEQVANLPEKLREVVDLLRYNGLTQQAAAESLGVSKATIKLKWLKAIKELRERVGGEEKS